MARVSPLRNRLAAAALASRNENVRRVELAWAAAITAEWAYFVALGVFAYHAGGASAVGLAGLIRLLPAGLVAPSAASLGDRIPRERLLVGAALLGSVAYAGSAVAAFAGSEAGVYACAAFVGISSTLIRPTLQALLPSLTPSPEELVAANAATSTVESLGTLVGPLVAGVLVEQARVGVTFAVAAAALAVGVVLLLRVHTQGPAAGRAASRGGPVSAWRTVVQHPGAPVVVTLMVAQAFVRGCLNVLIVVAAFRLLDGGGGTVGLLTAAIGAGGVIGAIVSSTYHGGRLARVFALSLVGWGLPIALVAPSPQLLAALVLLGIVGAANSVEDVSGLLHRDTAARPGARGSLRLRAGGVHAPGAHDRRLPPHEGARRPGGADEAAAPGGRGADVRAAVSRREGAAGHEAPSDRRSRGRDDRARGRGRRPLLPRRFRHRPDRARGG
ncbi:MAG: MFS transporter [Actinobacteria bacterium]|nr:MAG: MFS transporter [Actinomycetota bacterium]